MTKHGVRILNKQPRVRRPYSIQITKDSFYSWEPSSRPQVATFAPRLVLPFVGLLQCSHFQDWINDLQYIIDFNLAYSIHRRAFCFKYVHSVYVFSYLNRYCAFLFSYLSSRFVNKFTYLICWKYIFKNKLSKSSLCSVWRSSSLVVSEYYFLLTYFFNFTI